MRAIKKYENWKDSEKLRQMHAATNMFSEENVPNSESISGSSELDSFLIANYPTHRIKVVKDFDKGEILTGLLVKDDDSTLNEAFVYYYNTNYEISDVVVKKYPC